jgi:hypothetical protein
MSTVVVTVSTWPPEERHQQAQDVVPLRQVDHRRRLGNCYGRSFRGGSTTR